MKRPWLPIGVALVVACGAVPSAKAPQPVPFKAVAASGSIIQAPPPIPAAVPAGTPPCSSKDLETRAGDPLAGLGHYGQVILLRDRAAHPCFLSGHPDLVAYGSDGAVVDSAIGSTGEGTYFPDQEPPTDVLLEVGTPPLDAGHGAGTAGQARLVIEWWWCGAPPVDRVEASLSDGSRIVVPATPRRNATCEGGGGAGQHHLGRNRFAGIAGVAAGPQPAVQLTLRAPRSVQPGQVLGFSVVIEAPAGADYALDPCPDYVMIFGTKLAQASYRLNCPDAGSTIPAGGSRTFLMQLPIPAGGQARGPQTLTWTLLDGRAGLPSATTTVDLT